MRMLWVAPLLAAGCFSGGIDYPANPQDPIEDSQYYGEDEEMVRHVLESFRTSELGTDRTRPIAKTIEWPNISVPPGTPYVAGKAVVDGVLRNDSGNSYGVQVRLKNTTDEVLALEYRFLFVTRRGSTLIPYVGVSGVEERWTGFILEPFGVETAADFSRIIGAEGFLLFVRAQGDTGDGTPQAAQPE